MSEFVERLGALTSPAATTNGSFAAVNLGSLMPGRGLDLPPVNGRRSSIVQRQPSFDGRA